MKNKIIKILENIGFAAGITFGFYILYWGFRMIFFMFSKLFTH